MAKGEDKSENLERDFREHLQSVKNGERRSFAGLAKDLSRLPNDKARAVLETSASLASVSLRVSREFLQSAPRAADVLTADNLRAWGELGRRLAMTNADTGVDFFAEGVEKFGLVPPETRSLVFQICLRQLVLSPSVAIETFKLIPEIAREVKDSETLNRIFAVAAEIARRSAKHSADFLKCTTETVKCFDAFGARQKGVLLAAANLASAFAVRTGGMAADFWAGLPEVLCGLPTEKAIGLLEAASAVLEFGGSVTLHFLSAGGECLRRVPTAFAAWQTAVEVIGKHGNAVLIAFVRSSPAFFNQIAVLRKTEETAPLAVRVLNLVAEIAETDSESALACFRAAPRALRKVSAGQFEDWVREGLKPEKFETGKARRSYFALETRRSQDRLREGSEGLPLDAVQTILRLYIEALTDRKIEIAALSAAAPHESRINDGSTIYLPASVSEFGDDDLDFRLYKVLAAHAAGQIEFGTHAKDTPELKAAFENLAALYEATAEMRDAFSLAGYIEEVQKGEKALSPEAQKLFDRKRRKILPENSDYRAALAVFPEPALARKIFTTLENGRIDRRLRRVYKGLRRDLDLMRQLLRQNRPQILDLPVNQAPFELLFQIAVCGGAKDDAREFFSNIVVELETIVADYLGGANSTVADSLLATSRVYSLFQSVNPEQQRQQPEDSTETNTDEGDNQNENTLEVADKNQSDKQRDKTSDARDLFNAWNDLEENFEPEDWSGAETWALNEVPEQPLEADEQAFDYDEWDRELNDYRTGWSRVVEKRSRRGDRNFVESTRDKYRGVISSVRHQFQLMKPENLTRIHNEIDGEDYDLNALVDYFIDRRADGLQSDRLYTKKLRKQRDVAVAFLLDQSSSTARTIARNPLQPYTHPGKRIIEIEKEGLVLMSEALEAVGDIYSIYGFTSEGRRNVKFYVVKDFTDRYTEETMRRIGGITFQNNTRLGAAVRHAAAKLLKQDARTKLLVILTDGRPYDHDYGDARYAREDVREALRDAKQNGITPFCITIDRESEGELKDLYGDVGYTIIDDVLSLPERMPNIYRRLTS
jgi:nitric oxide reductase NorD protein